jgi:FSR family fosmidomycin resistance protein-like MFS transporter
LSTVTAPEKAGVLSQAAAAAAPLGEARLFTSTLVLLSLGHFSVDFYATAVATLQPVLVEHYGLSLTQAGIIGGTFMLASAMTQIVFGLASDRFRSRLFAVIGLVVTAVFFSAMGLAPGFKTLLLMIFVGGLGVAAFHPPSTSQVTTGGGRQRRLALSIFLTAGMLGVAFAPTYFSFLAERLGLESLRVAALPALPIAAFLLWRLPAMPNDRQKQPLVDWGAFRKHWRTLSLHYSLVVLRSVVQLALGQFLTLYLYLERGFSLKQASLGLTLFFFAAAVSAFAGAHLAERIGGRPVILFSMAASSPFLVVFLSASGWLSFLGLFIGSLILLLTSSVIVVMAQDLVPSQAGTIAGLMMGFGWGMAGIFCIPLIGWLSDRVGLETVLWGVVLLPLLGFLMALKLPRTAHG